MLVEVMLLLIGIISLTVFSWIKAPLKVSARGSSINIFEINGREQLIQATLVNGSDGNIEGNRENGTIVGKGESTIGIEFGAIVDCREGWFEKLIDGLLVGLDEGYSDTFTEGLLDSMEGRGVECNVGTLDGGNVGTVEGSLDDWYVAGLENGFDEGIEEGCGDANDVVTQEGKVDR